MAKRLLRRSQGNGGEKLIIAKDWVWLHFPKCAGTKTEHLLMENFSGLDDIHFDPINQKNVIWHHGIQERETYDPDFSLGDRKVICAIRRLPDWLLSRVHFEAARPPHRIPTREMFAAGRFYEITGFNNSADAVVRKFSRPRVDHWLRAEHLAKDLQAFFGPDFRVDDRKLNSNRFSYIRDWNFWFTPDELQRLYAENPVWAAIEEKLYGSLPIS